MLLGLPLLRQRRSGVGHRSTLVNYLMSFVHSSVRCPTVRKIRKSTFKQAASFKFCAPAWQLRRTHVCKPSMMLCSSVTDYWPHSRRPARAIIHDRPRSIFKLLHASQTENKHLIALEIGESSIISYSIGEPNRKNYVNRPTASISGISKFYFNNPSM